MKKIILCTTIALLAVCSFSANAQLSSGTPTYRHFKLGNRAQAGDFGFYIAAVAQGDGESMTFKNLSVTPMVNFKYMSSDNAEIRMSLEWYGNKERISGEVDAKEGDDIDLKCKNADSHFVLYPGFVWHFANTNVLDVYGGVEGLVGRIGTSVISQDPTSKAYTSRQKSSLNYGIGGVVGIQHYIWKLPISIGAEYSIIAKKETGVKYKCEVVDSEGKSEEYSTVDASKFDKIIISSSTPFESLSAFKSSAFNQLRITPTYYFN